MYDPITNPATIYDGLFVSFYLLSDNRISAMAKLLYVFLAGQANGRGEAIPDVSFTARILGAHEHQIYEALNQLEQNKYFTTRRNRVGTQFVHCRFVPPPWLKTPEPELHDNDFGGRQSRHSSPTAKTKAGEKQSTSTPVVDFSREGKKISRRNGKGEWSPRSAYPFEVCLEWARHCERRGDNFPRGVKYFAGWLWKFVGIRSMPQNGCSEAAGEKSYWLPCNPRAGNWFDRCRI